MRKSYFMLRPDFFVMHSDISKYGETQYQRCKEFVVEDPAENFVIFEVSRDADGKFGYYAKDIISGRVFDLRVVKPRCEKGEPSILITSDDYGIYQQDFVKLSEVEVRPIRVTGLLNYFNENEEPYAKYCAELEEFYEAARAYKHIYDNSISGPSNYLTRRIRNKFKKNSRY